MKSMRRSGGATIVVALVIACIAATPAQAGAQASPQPTTSPDLSRTVTIAADGAIDAPRELHAGIVHLAVTGTPGEALQLVAPRHGESAATLVADYQQFSGTGLPASTEPDFRFVGGSFVGADFYVDLRPGVYFAFDAGQSTLIGAHVATIRVVAGSVRFPIRLPGITGSITAIGADTWSAHPASVRGSGYLLFTNYSTQTHLVNLLQLTAGTSLAEVKAALANPAADVSSLSTGVYAEVGVVSPGGRELVSYSLPAGTYAVLDLWPDDATGQPHSALGMVRLISVS
jgi:hypothetical protein